MYPSDQLWRNIQDQLHEKGHWPALTFISIIIITLLVVSTLLLKPADKLLNNTKQRLATPEVQLALAPPPANAIQPLEENMATARLTQRTIDNANQKIHEQNILALAIEHTIDSVTRATTTAQVLLPAAHHLVVAQPEPAASIAAGQQDDSSSLAKAHAVDLTPAAGLSMMSQPTGGDSLTNSRALLNFAANTSRSSFNEDLLKNLGLKKTAPAISLKPNTPRFELQLYFTPSASYRRLLNEKTGKADLQTYLPAPMANTSNIDVNKVVRHKPAMGFELGAALGYKLNPQLTLKTGLQFNIRQYNIEAYAYNSDTVTSGRYSNGTGSTPVVLTNRYKEISLPIGVDWKARPHKRLTWGLSAIVAPTYMFNKDPFVLTTNFKDYTDGSSLMRHWNINTSFETYISYRIGGLRWQIGPQFRYQQLSTFKTQYPIKEYLLDYGIKFSVTKTIR